MASTPLPPIPPNMAPISGPIVYMFNCATIQATDPFPQVVGVMLNFLLYGTLVMQICEPQIETLFFHIDVF
ncbi:hypothetical protein H0H93_006209 [Arthromyces matolae]|nr:hypothetical protein H0H93_006209 [Arthromyces matolae]